MFHIARKIVVGVLVCVVYSLYFLFLFVFMFNFLLPFVLLVIFFLWDQAIFWHTLLDLLSSFVVFGLCISYLQRGQRVAFMGCSFRVLGANTWFC